MKKWNISMGALTRLIVLLLALINQTLVMLGHRPLPIDDATVTQLITLLFTVVSSLWSYWKNNSWTTHAKEADKVLHGKAVALDLYKIDSL